MKQSVSITKRNTFVLLDMDFKDLACVDSEYDDPETQDAIQWIRQHSSFHHIDNNTHDAGGVYDFLFNLNMLESYASDFNDSELAPMFKQLSDIKAAGYNYILFNQGC